MHRFEWICLVGLCLLGSARGQDGLFADFSTAMGDFTVQLDFERAPRAAASFVGLATGEAGWADPQGNVWHGRKFYDGTLFHRIATNATGVPLAIQGGGLPNCGITFTDLPAGPATSEGSSLTGQTSNPPGVITNDFIGLASFTTTNAAAVPTNYSYGGETVVTNAPALTRTVIYLLARSSNATTYVMNSYYAESWYTNHTLQEIVTTNYASIYTVTTNNGASPEVWYHYVQASMASTSTILGPVVNTNFVNAGYYMQDSATNGLTHSNGVISMANSGPNTDGSQFFITTTNVPEWNENFTVFGHVTTGLDVVASIAAVAVQGSGSRPVQDVALHSVAVRRVGPAAEMFSIGDQGIPEVGSANILKIDATGDVARIDVAIPPYSEILFRISTNELRTWSRDDWGYQTNGTPQVRTAVANLARVAFFHAACIRYPDAWTAPTSHAGRIFNFDWNTDPGIHYRAAFTNASGTWEKTQGSNFLSGAIQGGLYTPQWTGFPYSAKFYFADNAAGGGQYFYSLRFDSGKATNRFTCVMRPWAGGAYPISGTFTVR